jgi:hypothetical protein
MSLNNVSYPIRANTCDFLVVEHSSTLISFSLVDEELDKELIKEELTSLGEEDSDTLKAGAIDEDSLPKELEFEEVHPPSGNNRIKDIPKINLCFIKITPPIYKKH